VLANFETEEEYLGKRTQYHQAREILELQTPSKFFLVTNNYYKLRNLRM